MLQQKEQKLKKSYKEKKSGYKPLEIENKQTGIVTEYVGHKRVRDIDTGEVIELECLTKRVKHSLKRGWKRVYLEQFMQLLTGLYENRRKLDIIEFILNNLNSENQFTTQQQTIIKELAVSPNTIVETYKYLTKTGFWKKTGLCFTVSPKFVCAFGSDSKNKAILVRFEDDKEEQLFNADGSAKIY